MLKRNFDAFLPIVVSLAIMAVIVNAYLITNGNETLKIFYKQDITRGLLLCSPGLILIEAAIYWRFSKRNNLYILSFAYLILVVLSYSAPALANLALWLYGRPDNIQGFKDFAMAVVLIHWSLFFLAGMAAVVVYVVLLVKISSQPSKRQHDPVNLLDDVMP